MPSALIISASNIATDPRVQRHIDALKDHFRLTVAGFGNTPIPDTEVVELAPSKTVSFRRKLVQRLGLIPRRFEWYYWRLPYVKSAVTQLQGRTFSAILANDVQMLPFASRLAAATGARLVYDAHEYAPRQFEDLLLWRTFVRPYNLYLLERYLPYVDTMTTVGEAIAEAYRTDFGVECHVLTNAGAHVDLEPQAMSPGRVRIVHHGAANPSRKIERMIETMDHVDERFTLDLVLVPNSASYLENLKRFAASRSNVRFRDPVALDDIPSFLNSYDIGIYMLPPESFNQRYALPNKFFEFVQARLAVAIGPSIEMERLLTAHGFGVIAPDFSPRAMARTLNDLTAEEIMAFKNRAHDAAAILNANKNARLLLECMSG